MSSPLFYFVNRQGIKLPEEDGYQRYRQYGGFWAVEVEGDWNGCIGLLDESGIFPLTKISANQWAIPENAPRGEEIATRAGSITAVLLDSNLQYSSSTPQAKLWIKPAGLQESQLQEMIEEIGLLALSFGSLVNQQAAVSRGESNGKELGKKILPGGQLLITAEALLELYRSVHDIWAEIEKRPLRSFKQEIISVDITKKVNSPQAIISRILNPTKRQILTTSSTESLNCSENEFLCYLLDVYLQEMADSLIKGIERTSEQASLINDNLFPHINGSTDNKISSFLDNARNNYDLYKSTLDTDNKKRNKLLETLRQCKKWANNARKNSFLAKIITPDNLNLNSQRLIKSLTYGSILEAYYKYNGGHLAKFDQIIRLYRETTSLSVRKTWELYEIWCFIKLYSVIATQLRLSPPSNDSNLFESINLNNGEISIPKNREFQLQGEFKNKTRINISLWYEREEITESGNLRPDFKMKVTINGAENIYHFDAKYRNYKNQGVKRFIEDVIDTAKNKYLDRLKANASFIFHSDSRCDFWGEVPLDNFVGKSNLFKEYSSDITSRYPEYINHRYGAISLTPGNLANHQIERLIKLIFQYHDQYCTTCLNCGCEAEAQTTAIPKYWTEERLKNNIINRVPDNWKGAGIYCSCKECGDFWVVQRCYGMHHRLLKFRNSFHQRSANYPNNWIYLCPECGSDLYKSG